jgi:RNA polymerase sigma-70 factor, ECF subfamily
MVSTARSGISIAAPPSAAFALADDEIVPKIVAGEVALFEVLMRRYNQRLYRVARAIVGSNDAEDVVQQGYLDAFMHLDQFEGRASVISWLTRIVANRAIRLRASSRRLLLIVDEDVEQIAGGDGSAPERAATREELLQALESAIDELPEGYRAAFVLRDVEDMSTHEAAEILGVTEEALKVRLHRARTLVKARLGRDVPELVAEVFAFGLTRCDRMVAAVLAVALRAPSQRLERHPPPSA